MTRGLRRLGALAVAALLVLPTGCASGGGGRGVGWETGMMGAMVVGGLIFGTGVMHGGRRAAAPDTAVTAARFAPDVLLERRGELELTDDQVAALEALRADVAAERLTAEAAAQQAFALLRPVQRVAARSGPPAGPPHH